MGPQQEAQEEEGGGPPTPSPPPPARPRGERDGVQGQPHSGRSKGGQQPLAAGQER